MGVDNALVMPIVSEKLCELNYSVPLFFLMSVSFAGYDSYVFLLDPGFNRRGP